MSKVIKKVGKAVGKIAKVALPIVASVFAPGIAGALGVTSTIGKVAVGAGLGAAASAITGGNPLHGAVMGGVGGYLGGGQQGPEMLTADQVLEVSQHPEALQAYINAGMVPQGMLDQAAAAWNALPQAARDAYLSAGYSPTHIGMAAAKDAGLLGSATSAFDARSIVNSLVKSAGGMPGVVGLASGLLGSHLQADAASNAAMLNAQAQIEAAKIAAEAAKFRPVGVTTRFGSSSFDYDPYGNLIRAGYSLSPELKTHQDALMGIAGGMLDQYKRAQAATAPLFSTAGRALELGSGYLAKSPQEQAAKYMAEQQALLAPSRERDLALLRNKLFQEGRLGLATGGTSTGMMAANPELEAFYNAQRMQDLDLAARATQGGMDYAKFGAGLSDAAIGLAQGALDIQTAAYKPYQTAIGGAEYLENLGRGAMDIGTAIGAKTSTSAANAGHYLAQGMMNAANARYPAQAYSPWGNFFSGLGGALRGWR